MTHYLRFGFVLLLIVCIVGCRDTSSGSGEPRTAPPTLPFYPGMKNGTMSSTPDSEGDYTIVFETTDTPAQVIAFYKEQLTLQRWSEPSGTDERLYMTNRFGCPFYHVSISTEMIASRRTRITLDLLKGLCGEVFY